MPAFIIGIIIFLLTLFLGFSTPAESRMKAEPAGRGPADFIPLIIATVILQGLLLFGLFLCASELSYVNGKRGIFGYQGETNAGIITLLIALNLLLLVVPLIIFMVRMKDRGLYRSLRSGEVVRYFAYFVGASAIVAALYSLISMKLVEDKPGFLMGIGSLLSLIITGIAAAWAAFMLLFTPRQ